MNKRYIINRLRAWLILSGILIFFGSSATIYAEGFPKGQMNVNIDWPSFLERCDPVWDVAPTDFEESPRLGNGRIGMYMYKESGQGEHPASGMVITGDVLHFGVDREDIYDHRDSSWGWTAHSKPRFHPGDFKLQTVGKMTDMYVRQDLYNAEWRGTITTEKGEIKFRSFIHHERPVIVVEMETTGAESNAKWTFNPTEAISSRKDAPGRGQFWPDSKKNAENYFKLTGENGENIQTQSSLRIPERWGHQPVCSEITGRRRIYNGLAGCEKQPVETHALHQH